MGLRWLQCFVFAMSLLLSSGSSAKEPEDSSLNVYAPETPLHPTTKLPVNVNGKVQCSTLEKRALLPRSELKPLNSTPQFDVVTPIPTVPLSNPTNPTAVRTPSYDPLPTLNPIDPYTTSIMGTPSSSSSSGSSWCIATQSASPSLLQSALDYACGFGGADCSQIQPGGSCFIPDTVRDHASYAFNDYYGKKPIPSSCNFGGTAAITNVDPSVSTCQYPSTSTSSSILNTTNPSGSAIYGSAPSDSSGRDPMSKALTQCLTFFGILISGSI